MFSRHLRSLRVRSRRSLGLRLAFVAFAAVLISGLLTAVVVSVRSDNEVDTEVAPADVEKQKFPVIPDEERPAYTPDDAAAVVSVDPVTPTIQNGTIVAELEPHDLPGFELLGVTWTDGVPAGVAEVQVRWRQDGTWSPWTLLDPEDGEVEGGVPGTAPKWVGPSDAAQARVVAADDIEPKGLTLVTVDPGETPTLTPAASVSQPSIIMRSQWGAQAYGGSGCGSAPANGTFTGTIVHHTAGSNSYTAAQSAGIVKSIQAYHMDGQGWCDIGYNFLIDRYGQIFEGRAGGITNTPYGAHAGNTAVNANTTGVSLMGEFTSEVPPDAMKNSLVQLIAWRHSLFNVPAKGSYSIGGVTIQRIDGHRSVKATACPGQQVFNWLNASGGLRDQVEAAILTGSVGFVKAPNDDKVYLLANGNKHHVVDGSEFAVLASRFGTIQTIDASVLSSYPTGPSATRYARDQQTQTLYLLHADGTKHRFPTIDLVGKYGYQVDSYLPLTTEQLDRFTTGEEVGSIFAVESGNALYLMDGWTRRHITTYAAWVQVRGTSTSVARMSAGNAARYSVGPALLEPSVLVKEQSSPSVYLSVNDNELVHIPSFALARDMGSSRLVTVGDGLLTGNPKASGSLGPAFSCGSSDYLVGDGKTFKIESWGTSGLTPVKVSDEACPAFDTAAETLEPPFFVKSTSNSAVYLIEQGQMHHVRSWSRLVELAADGDPRILSWSASVVAAFPVGAPELAANSFIQFSGLPEVYRGNGRTIQHVSSYEALVRLGGGSVPPIEQLPAVQKSYYTVGSPIS
ncbi:MAG: N-acetylmuramoyl-L-alanine amidase [Aeromicrobium sp.]|uniref:peptidoglycan recognition protein family protein n=1 Tax=Aeromicrobium sp. TaxID=1871063 RepID=UPI0039E6D504